MRFFIALEIPDESKQELEDVQQGLKNLIPNFKPSFVEKLHLTIAFVGEQPDELKERLIEVMTRGAEGISGFSVSPAYIDGFPHLHQARVLWIGVKGDIDKLYILRHRIKDGLMDLNLSVDERRFVPHIALGKVSNLQLSPLQEEGLEKIELQTFKPIRVNSIKLFESIPNQGFHEHNTLAEIKLE
jgi:RNA 2',3'-cyclic 3'-phosphodiesterase